VLLLVIIVAISFFILSIVTSYTTILRGKFKEEQEISKSLRKKNEIKTKFLAFAAHNLRTPATALRWSLNDFLKNEYVKLTKNQQGSIQSLYSISLTMINIIEDFLDISRLELQKFEISLKAISLGRLKEAIEHTIEEFTPISKEKKISIESTFDIKEELLVYIDLIQISRITENLIENAVNYSHSGSAVHVQLKNDKEFVSLSIKDAGIGIPKTEHPMIFGEFFRSSNAKKHKSTGSGIGLYIARKLIEAHDGTIFFTSEEGAGSTFTFKIPMTAEGKREVLNTFKRI